MKPRPQTAWGRRLARCPYCERRKRATAKYDHGRGWLCCPSCDGVFPWRNKSWTNRITPAKPAKKGNKA